MCLVCFIYLLWCWILFLDDCMIIKLFCFVFFCLLVCWVFVRRSSSRSLALCLLVNCLCMFWIYCILCSSVCSLVFCFWSIVIICVVWNWCICSLGWKFLSWMEGCECWVKVKICVVLVCVLLCLGFGEVCVWCCFCFCCLCCLWMVGLLLLWCVGESGAFYSNSLLL